MDEQKMSEWEPSLPRTPPSALFDKVMATLLIALAAFGLVNLVLVSQVDRRVPAGHVRGVTLGGFAPKSLVETETGFYPLYGVARFERGASVSLELRSNGEWMLCGPDERSCIRTSDDAWQQATAIGAP